MDPDILGFYIGLLIHFGVIEPGFLNQVAALTASE